MQFYICHTDPIKNAELLPDYAIKQVNVREGFQIISDVCRRFDVTFDGQNKAYNPFHPLTREFSHVESFKSFLVHYGECCNEYLRRFRKSRVEIECFIHFDPKKTIKRLPSTREAENLHYLLTRKIDKLTDNEFDNLIFAIENHETI